MGNIPHDKFMALYTITEERFNKMIDIYFKWKELNALIKEDYSRGINLPEAITEPICCYVNGFKLSIPTSEEKAKKKKNKGKKADEDEDSGSEDAIDPVTKEHVQIKGSSNWNKDLTSFGPKTHFNALHFVRLKQDEDRMYLYNIPVENLDNVQVNKNNTFKDFQDKGKRPRFSIIKKYIEVYNLSPYAYVDLKEYSIVRLDNE